MGMRESVGELSGKLCCLIAATLLMLFGGMAGLGQASEGFEIEFDQATFGVGDDAPLDYGAGGNTVSVSGNIDDGLVEIPASGFDFPELKIDGGPLGDIRVETGVTGTATGSFDSSTGRLEVELPMQVTLSTGTGSDCSYGPFTVVMSTDYQGTKAGAPFTVGLEGDGAVGGESLAATDCGANPSQVPIALWMGVTKGAKPFNIDFERADFKIGQLSLLAAKSGVKLKGRNKLGSIVVPSGGVIVPTAELSVGGQNVKVEFASPAGATGSYSATSGAMDLTIDLEMRVLSTEGPLLCQVDSVPLSLSTSSQGPPAGVAFNAALNRGLIGGGWQGTPQVVGSGCPQAFISSLQNTAMSMTLASGDLSVVLPPDPPDPPDPPGPTDPEKKANLALTPVKKSIKVGKKQKKVAVKVRLKNSGDAAAAGVKVCFTAPKWVLKRKTCQTVKTLAAGATSVRTVSLKPKRAKKARKASVTVSAAATGVKQRSTKVQLSVPKR